ncbi:MAG: NAD(P)-binding domain-containing protein [Chitinophagales bacterium]|nr:NAD(P)-binding domain-containing protein [Chitinophagales bacterium]
MKAKVLITAKEVDDIVVSELESMNYDVSHLPEPSEEQLLDVIGEYEGLIITTYTKVNKKVLAKAEKLKFVGRVGAGLENVDEQAAQEKGVAVFNSPEGNCNAVGEHALGLLLSVMNHIASANMEVKNGIWQREENRGEELDGKVVGIIGLGHTGTAFAKKLRGFDVEVLAYDKYKENYGTDFIKEVSLDELLQRADIISFHIPYSKSNHHFLNVSMIEKMQQKPYIMHTCRGAVMDTKAVLNALETQEIKALGIDVYEDEPWTKGKQVEIDSYKKLFSLKNVTATPHIAGWTKESKIKLAQVLMQKIKIWKTTQ